MKRFYKVLLLISILFILGFFLKDLGIFKLQNIQEILKNHFLLASLSFISLFIIGNLLQIPGVVFLAAAILGLGQISGYFLTLFAAYLSCIIGFYIINFLGKDLIREIKKPWVIKILNKLDQYPISIVILLRLVFQTYPPLNYTLALSGIKFRDYLIGSIIGLPVPIYIYTFFIEEILESIK